MSWMTAQSCELEQAMSQQLYNKRDTRECLLSCSLVTLPVYSMRQGQNSLTHKHAPMTAPRDLACVRGMKINRHWSRHAFRNNPKAQYTFKSLLVHGILQFTMLITLRCALHRCSSRDIRRWKLCLLHCGAEHQEQNTSTAAVQQITMASQHRKTVRCCSTTREPKHEEAEASSPTACRDS